MNERGFTLVELVLVLAIGAILLSIALPGYAFLVSGSRLSAATNDLLSALHLARSEAIKRQVRVTLCKTDRPPACNPNANWESGWLVFIDGGVRGAVDPGDLVLWQKSLQTAAAVITASNFHTYVSYLPSGFSQGPNNFGNGKLHICVNGQRRDIVINRQGRPRLESHFC